MSKKIGLYSGLLKTALDLAFLYKLRKFLYLNTMQTLSNFSQVDECLGRVGFVASISLVLEENVL